MGRSIPRFLLSNATKSKSKGTFIIHTLEPGFIAQVYFNEIRQIIDYDIVRIFKEELGVKSAVREIADKELATWWKYAGIHESSDPRDQLISQLTELKCLRKVACEHFTVDEVREIIRIIFPTKAKTFLTTTTSYGLKHDMERISELFMDRQYKYCNNETLKQAMIEEGFRSKVDVKGSPNLYFNISEREWRRISKMGYFRTNNQRITESF